MWIEAARGLARFEGEERAFRRFLFTVARRRAIDRGRTRQRRRTDPRDPAGVPDAVEVATPEAMVLERAGGLEAVERIRALLPAEQAEVVLLRVVAGLSVGEVAAVIGRKPAAVSVLQHRALRRLADRLAPPWEARGGCSEPSA